MYSPQRVRTGMLGLTILYVHQTGLNSQPCGNGDVHFVYLFIHFLKRVNHGLEQQMIFLIHSVYRFSKSLLGLRCNNHKEVSRCYGNIVSFHIS